MKTNHFNDVLLLQLDSALAPLDNDTTCELEGTGGVYELWVNDTRFYLNKALYKDLRTYHDEHETRGFATDDEHPVVEVRAELLRERVAELLVEKRRNKLRELID